MNVIKSYRVMRGDEDVTANYIFDDSVDGTLTVTKRKVTLTSGTACKIYDGKYLTCNKVEVGGDGFVEGEGATYDVTGKRKDIGWSSTTSPTNSTTTPRPTTTRSPLSAASCTSRIRLKSPRPATAATFSSCLPS